MPWQVRHLRSTRCAVWLRVARGRAPCCRRRRASSPGLPAPSATGPSSPMETPGVRAAQVDVGAARWPPCGSEVVGAGEEGGEGRGERPACRSTLRPTAAATSCCSAMNISKKRSGKALLELVGVGRVATPRRPARPRPAGAAPSGHERVAVGLARRHLAAHS